MAWSAIPIGWCLRAFGSQGRFVVEFHPASRPQFIEPLISFRRHRLSTNGHHCTAEKKYCHAEKAENPRLANLVDRFPCQCCVRIRAHNRVRVRKLGYRNPKPRQRNDADHH